MNKYGAVITVVFLMIVVYLMLMVVMPILTAAALTANTTMNATSNMSLYPGTSPFLISIPWIVWFIPGCLGIGIIVAILRSGR